MWENVLGDKGLISTIKFIFYFENNGKYQNLKQDNDILRYNNSKQNKTLGIQRKIIQKKNVKMPFDINNVHCQPNVVIKRIHFFHL